MTRRDRFERVARMRALRRHGFDPLALRGTLKRCPVHGASCDGGCDERHEQLEQSKKRSS